MISNPVHVLAAYATLKGMMDGAKNVVDKASDFDLLLKNKDMISDKALSVGIELIANIVNAAFQKYVPVIEVHGDTVIVKIGSIEHPMLDAHYIEWIVLVIEGGMQMKWLKPGMKPEAMFKITDKLVTAFEYCNIYGLWKATV